MTNNDGWSGYIDPGPYLIAGLKKDAPIGSTFELPDPILGEPRLLTIESEDSAGDEYVKILINKINGMWHHNGAWIDKHRQSLIDILVSESTPQSHSNYWSERFFENQEKRKNECCPINQQVAG